jgi:hypothetical protein
MAKYTRRRTVTRKAAAASSKRCGRNKTKKSSVSRRRRAQHGGKWPFGKKDVPAAIPVATEGTGIRIGIGNLDGSKSLIPPHDPAAAAALEKEEWRRKEVENAACLAARPAAMAAEVEAARVAQEAARVARDAPYFAAIEAEKKRAINRRHEWFERGEW